MTGVSKETQDPAYIFTVFFMPMIETTIHPEIKGKLPALTLCTIQCTIVNSLFNNDLWGLIEQEIKYVIDHYPDFTAIKNNPRIAATRDAYKTLGKDPNRYRPSAESLMRRLLKNRGLFQVNAAVDVINLISLRTGFSIGAFDVSKMVGPLIYRKGKPDDQYKGIGRGKLNVENLPLLCGQHGGIGNPTSDEERTALSETTAEMFININAFTGKHDVLPEVDVTNSLLVKFLNAKNISVKLVV